MRNEWAYECQEHHPVGSSKLPHEELPSIEPEMVSQKIDEVHLEMVGIA